MKINDIKNKIIFSAIMVASYTPPNSNVKVPTTTPITGQTPLTIGWLIWMIQVIASFLIMIAPVMLVACLVTSAIIYMTSGNNTTRLGLAKNLFWYSIIGGFIVFGVGVIINTIASIVSRDFFCQHLMINIGPFGNICF